MAKTGRKSKYETVIKPKFNDIKTWLENGATEQQVAINLGIAYSTFLKWKAEKIELSDICKNSRHGLVLKLRGALVKKAMGYKYSETKKTTIDIKLPDEMKKCLLENGFKDIEKAKLIKTEVSEKEQTPDVAALNLALKNYDKENWANDPQLLELKKEELKIKKDQIEKGDW